MYRIVLEDGKTVDVSDDTPIMAFVEERNLYKKIWKAVCPKCSNPINVKYVMCNCEPLSKKVCLFQGCRSCGLRVGKGSSQVRGAQCSICRYLLDFYEPHPYQRTLVNGCFLFVKDGSLATASGSDTQSGQSIVPRRSSSVPEVKRPNTYLSEPFYIPSEEELLTQEKTGVSWLVAKLTGGSLYETKTDIESIRRATEYVNERKELRQAVVNLALQRVQAQRLISQEELSLLKIRFEYELEFEMQEFKKQKLENEKLKLTVENQELREQLARGGNGSASKEEELKYAVRKFQELVEDDEDEDGD